MEEEAGQIVLATFFLARCVKLRKFGLYPGHRGGASRDL